MSKLDARARRALFTLAGAGFVSGASMRVSEPMLPTLAADFATSIRAASMVIAAFTLAYGAFQIVHGTLGDRIGKLRAVKWAAALAAIATLACALAPSLNTLVSFRFLSGVFSGAVVPLSMAWMGDRFEYATRQAILGRFIGGILMGQAFGPLIGGALNDFVGWRATFGLLASGFLVVSLLLWSIGKSEAPQSSTKHPPPWRQYAALLRSSNARAVLLTVSIEGFLFYGTFGFIGAYLHEKFSLSYTAVGMFVAAFGVGGLLYSFAVRVLVARLGETGMVLAGGFTLLAAFGALALAPSSIVVVPALLSLGFGFYMLHNTLQTHGTELAPQARGMGVSLFACCLFLSQSVGVSAMGWIVEHFGFAWSLWLAGGGLLVLAWWFRVHLEGRRKPVAP